MSADPATERSWEAVALELERQCAFRRVLLVQAGICPNCGREIEVDGLMIGPASACRCGHDFGDMAATRPTIPRLRRFYPPAGPCTLPPPSWTCSRQAGHSGPCAASRTRLRRGFLARLWHRWFGDPDDTLPDGEKVVHTCYRHQGDHGGTCLCAINQILARTRGK